MQTQHFQRKPIVVEAVRVTDENFTEVAHWCQGAINAPHGWTLDSLKGIKDKHIKVRVINPQRVRQTKAFVGDWVLYSEYNGYKVYTNGAFENAFVPAESKTVQEAVDEIREKTTPPENVVQISPANDERVPDGTYGGSRPA